MFYIPELLQKKGAWALIWLAGTDPKRIQSRSVQNVSVENLWYINQTIIFITILHLKSKDIIESEIPLSLRLSAILLYGVVFIYHTQME